MLVGFVVLIIKETAIACVKVASIVD